MALVGPEGSGKSHLAAIWAETTGARPCSLRSCYRRPICRRLLATGALVVEDLDPTDLDERALFHLINLAKEERAYVLLTSRTAPAGFPVAIRDLASRLRAGAERRAGAAR